MSHSVVSTLRRAMASSVARRPAVLGAMIAFGTATVGAVLTREAKPPAEGRLLAPESERSGTTAVVSAEGGMCRAPVSTEQSVCEEPDYEALVSQEDADGVDRRSGS